MRNTERLDRMLDEALEMTFPASDPFTVYRPEAHIADGLAFDEDHALASFAIAA